MSASDRQVGGSHYVTDGEQVWDRIFRLYGPGFFIGNIEKYVERYRKKDGVKDLKKAQHFLEKLIELEEEREEENAPVEIALTDLPENPD